MTKHEALTIVASLCADGVLDAKEEAILRKALDFPQRKPLTLNWEPIREFWRNNSGINWDELEAAIKVAHGIKEST